MQAVIEIATGHVVFYLDDETTVDLRPGGMRSPWIVPDVTSGTHAHLQGVAPCPDYASGHWSYAEGQWIVRDEAAWAEHVARREAAAAQAMVSALRTELFAEYERRTQAISAGYPDSERESWPVQISEARALQADPAEIGRAHV